MPNKARSRGRRRCTFQFLIAVWQHPTMFRPPTQAIIQRAENWKEKRRETHTLHSVQGPISFLPPRRPERGADGGERRFSCTVFAHLDSVPPSFRSAGRTACLQTITAWVDDRTDILWRRGALGVGERRT